MRNLTSLILCGFLALLLAACNQPAAEPTPAPVAPEPTTAANAPTEGYPAPVEAYPDPNAAPTEAYPEPTSPSASTDPIVVPAPSSNEVGVVTGTLLRITEDGQQVPYENGILFLGTIVPADTGADGMVAVNKEVDPQARTNGLGQFVFVDVPPGRYGIMLDTLQATVLLNEPTGANNGDLIIEVTGGGTVDLGELAYPLPEP